MFCPKCRSEYREGFTECADCHLPLIAELPPLQPEEGEEIPPLEELDQFVELCSVASVAEVAFIQSILDGTDITYFVQNFFNQLYVGAGRARILVNAEQLEDARELLKDFKPKNYSLFNRGEHLEGEDGGE